LPTTTPCPHLGLSYDRSLLRTEPDEEHRCYAQLPPAVIDAEHQRAFCLTSEHVICPFFIHPNRSEPPPEDEEEDLEEFVESLLSNKPVKVEEEGDLSKEELLKKFGIKAPDDDLIDNFVSNVIVPDTDELKNLEDEFRDKITKFLEGEDDIQSFSLDLSVEYDEGYVCTCNVDLYPKKKFGIIKKM